jgi:hypothetical protein
VAGSSADSVARPSFRAERFLVLGLLGLADLILIAALLRGIEALVAVAGLLALALALLRLEWLAALILLGAPLVRPLQQVAGGESLLLGLRVLALGWLALTLGRRRAFLGWLLREPVFVATSLLLVLLLAGVSWSGAQAYGAGKAHGFAWGPWLFLLLALGLGWRWGQRTPPAAGVKHLLGAGWVLLVAIAAVALGRLIGGLPAGETRLRVLGLNPIWLGRWMGMGILLVPFAVIRLRWPVSLTLLVLAGFAVALAATGSRGPMVATALALPLVAALLALRRGRRAALGVGAAMLGAILVLGLAYVFLPAGVRERLEQPVSDGFDLSWSLRLYLLRTALALVPGAGLLGYGTGGFAFEATGGDVRFYPHNVLLEILLENGWLGLLLFGVILAGAVRALWRLRGVTALGPETATVGGLFAYALVNAMVSGDLPVNEGVWIWSGLLVALAALTSARPRVGGDPGGSADTGPERAPTGDTP